MLGKRPVFSIARCSRWPVATSSFMRSTASSYTMLPVAPATEPMASTSGTPAANMVDRVRAKRAMADLTRIGPMMGNLSMMRSIVSCIFRERLRK